MTDAPESAASEPFHYPWRYVPLLVVLFAGVHAIYFALGVRFDRSTLDGVMHFLDPELLSTRLVESVWYLHIQPPFLNLFAGILLKISPEGTGLFHLVFLAFGFLLYGGSFLLQARLGVHPRLAAFLSTAFMASPSFILWEHYFFYTLPCAALLIMATLALFDVIEKTSIPSLIIFFGALFLLCGTWTMFHLVYFAVVWITVAVFSQHRRRIVILGCIPFLLLLGVYLKNYMLFGEFNLCSFSEKNLWIMSVGNMRGEDKVRLVQNKELSELSLINRWAHLDAYPASYGQVPENFRDIPALSQPYKSTGGVNYNHVGFIGISEVYGKDARHALRHHPRVFLTSVLFSTYRYFMPSSTLPVSPENQAHIAGIIRFYDSWVYGKLPLGTPVPGSLRERLGHPPYVLLIAGLVLAWGYGMGRLLMVFFLRPAESPPRRISLTLPFTLCFMCATILMVAGVGCCMDFCETSRYRFVTDGLSLGLFGMLVNDVIYRLLSVNR
ncbi:MAG TPA: hypothetical protein PLI09_23155 [Candidatus Hydrogenedentes bacterium]|nr:hypothetical protein [Candidatus Hydrogenedentota bacterium]